ncbi:MAG: GNAT family N-acetyltransferase [Pseudomonadota bacterium]|nr:GNAT family N-acetyltransferase [Pseudomonadota bacterium]
MMTLAQEQNRTAATSDNYQVDLLEVLPNGWDDFQVAFGSQVGLLQSMYWGSLMVALDRGKPIYFVVRQGDRIAATLLAVHLRWPANWGQRLFLSILGLGGGRIDFGCGPALADDIDRCQVLDLLLVKMHQYVRKNGVSIVRSSGFSPVSNIVCNVEIQGVFLRNDYAFNNWATYVLNLTSSEDDLLMSLDHSARKGIKKALREGVSIRKIDTWDSYQENFLRPYLDWTINSDRDAFTHDANIIWHHPGHSRYYHYFTAFHRDGRALAVLGMYVFAGVATEITSAIAPVAFDEKIPVQDILHWEMFLEAKRQGCHYFDLAGVAPNPGSQKEENIRRFKKKWGGQYVVYDRYEWQHPVMRKLLHVVDSMTRLLGKLRSHLRPG